MARWLRRSLTPAEKALWRELRRLPLPHSHFRKQAPFGPYAVDFVCHAARIVVEVDGGAHEAPDQAEHDAERQAWIESRGYKVMRLSNALVLRDAREAAQQVWNEARSRM
jgi:very-short-patch-repair endonuclease